MTRLGLGGCDGFVIGACVLHKACQRVSLERVAARTEACFARNKKWLIAGEARFASYGVSADLQMH